MLTIHYLDIHYYCEDKRICLEYFTWKYIKCQFIILELNAGFTKDDPISLKTSKLKSNDVSLT